MITGAVKNRIDKIWLDIYSAGLANPLTVIEQLTYLMFIRSLDVRELENESYAATFGMDEQFASPPVFPQTPGGQAMRWSHFKDKNPETIFNIISKRLFPAIKAMEGGKLPDVDENGQIPGEDGKDSPDSAAEAAGEEAAKTVNKEQDKEDDKTAAETSFARFMKDAVFLLPTPQITQKVVTALEELYVEEDIARQDMQGDLYEYMLSKLSTAGRNGQFRTPRHIREMMVELMRPTADDIICDPACGTAGFLISAAEYIRAHQEGEMSPEQWEHFYGPAFTGYDTDPTMLRLSAMNLMLHAITHPDIRYRDSVSKENDVTAAFTLCLANPPFKGSIDSESISDTLKAVTSTKKTELLFLALFLRLLKKGGRCACIVPDGVLFGSSKAHLSLRKELVEKHQLQAVISMPSGVFRPYAGVSTAILIFVKTGAGGTENVWFYDMKADGFSLDDKRAPVTENDIPDVIARYHNLEAERSRARTEQSFFVPKEDIVASGYNLGFNTYRQEEYTAEEYPPTQQLMAELQELETQIAAEFAKLKEML